MNSIVEYFNQAQLALATYATLTPGVDPVPALQDSSVGMAPTQASAFAAKWNVVTQYTDPITDVSATVFQTVSGGPKYLAIRGTDGLADIGTDIDLAVGLPMELNLQYIALKDQVQTWLGNGTLASGFTVSGHKVVA